MSILSQVLEKLTSITNSLNSITSNSKKIDELPTQDTLDVNSKIHVSRNGTSESLRVDQIINAVNTSAYDKILNVGEITIASGVISIPSGAQWRINNDIYTKSTVTNITIPLAAAGLNRIDIIVANDSGNIVRVAGSENLIAVKPNEPFNSVLITQINVTDSDIGDPTPPIIGEDFVKKRESQDVFANNVTAVLDQLDLYDDRSDIVFTASITDLKSIEVSGEFMRPGKIFRFKNRQSVNVKLWHLAGTGLTKFKFPNDADFTLKPKEIIEFSLNANDSSVPRLEYIGIINSSSGVTSNVISTYKTATSSNLTTQDVAGFLTYINGVTSFAIAANEIVKYTITDTQQIFEIKATGSARSVGSGQAALSSTDILEVQAINWAKLFPIHQSHIATGVSLQVLGDLAMSETTTIANILVGGISFRRVRSASTAGSNANISGSSFSRIGPNKGFWHQMRLRNADASTISDVKFVYGLGQTGSFSTGEPSGTLNQMNCMSADSTDVNCQILFRNLTSSNTKIDLGSNFPKTAQHEYIITFYRMPSSTTTVYHVKNVTTGHEASGTFQSNPAAGLSPYMNRNNNATAVACGFELQRSVTFIES